MQKRPIAIALAVAGIVAGTAGIAAVNSESTGFSADAATTEATTTQQVEVQVPAETMNAEPQTQAQAQMTAPAPEPMTAPKRSKTGDQQDAKIVRIPFTNIHLKVIPSPTFPGGAIDTQELSPSIAAYFDRKNANIVLTGAARPVFPGGSSDSPELLPSVVAYFDRVESQKLASTRPAPTNTAAVAADSPVTTMSSASETNATTVKSEIQVSQLPGT